MSFIQNDKILIMSSRNQQYLFIIKVQFLFRKPMKMSNDSDISIYHLEGEKHHNFLKFSNIF